MGTNFYMHTKDKDIVRKYAPYSFEITDEPEFCYEFHIAKTSMGWLPLFQAHEMGIQSVKQYKSAYDDGCEIYDEYGDKYTWNEFTIRVLKFNGGTVKDRKVEKIKKTKTIIGNEVYYDSDMPDYVPISHFEYGNGKYASDYFKDDDGYEFDIRWFR